MRRPERQRVRLAVLLAAAAYGSCASAEEWRATGADDGTWDVNVVTDGVYALNFDYEADADRWMFLSVDGGDPDTRLAAPASDKSVMCSRRLAAGRHRLKLHDGESGRVAVSGVRVGPYSYLTDQSPAEQGYEACTAVIRCGGVDGRPYWNAHAIMFMYPPAFGFEPVAGATAYRYEIVDDVHKKLTFKSDAPTDDLAGVWPKLRTGYVTVTVIGENEAGRDLGVAGTRTFWKKATFRNGSYPPAKCAYDECARKIYGYLIGSRDCQYTLRTGRLAESFDNRYPAKMMSALIEGMIRYAGLDESVRDTAMRLARQAADALLAVSEGEGSRYPGFPPTYNPARYEANYEWPNRRRCMTLYPAEAAAAYLKLYQATKDAKYLAATRTIAETFLSFQGEDGTWPLTVDFDKGPDGNNRMMPLDVAVLLDKLHGETGDGRYRKAGDRAFAYVEKTLIASWNWEGQFEDSPPTEHYRNLTMHPPCSTAIYLLERYPDDPAKRTLARELLRFAEDQFVNWERPYDNGRRIPDAKAFSGYYNHFWKQDRWITPSVLEQYGCYAPVDASAAKLIRTYLALYRAERNPVDLAKAKALGDVATRCTYADGYEATWWTEDEVNYGAWPNCMLLTAAALLELSAVR